MKQPSRVLVFSSVLLGFAGLWYLAGGPRGLPSDDTEEIELTSAQADSWADYIEPHGEETLWKEIAWRTSVWEAILEARETEKPLLIWSMNGHPEGFT